LYEYGEFRIESKDIAILMGHLDISVTLNIYMHTGYDDAKKKFAGLKR